MPHLTALLREMKLDSQDMKAEQFMVAVIDGNIAGFGRLYQHPDSLELGSVGTVPAYRERGVAKAIIQALIKRASTSSIYLSTIIPDFWKQFGFKDAETIPASLTRSPEYCADCKPYLCHVMVLHKEGPKEGK